MMLKRMIEAEAIYTCQVKNAESGAVEGAQNALDEDHTWEMLQGGARRKD